MLDIIRRRYPVHPNHILSVPTYYDEIILKTNRICCNMQRIVLIYQIRDYLLRVARLGACATEVVEQVR